MYVPSLVLRLTAVALALVLSAGRLSCQLLTDKVSFEVVSIKTSTLVLPRDLSSVGMKVSPGRVDMGHMSLEALVCSAYRIKLFQLLGPSWMAERFFDIHAKMSDGSSVEQVPEMLQSMLADRFGLVIHLEAVQRTAYALVVGRNGLKLTEAPPSTVSKTTRTLLAGGAMRIAVSRTSLTGLADLLSRFLGQAVIDETDVAGEYAVTFNLSRRMAWSDSVSVSAADDEEPLLASLNEQGLRLQSKKATVNITVVDKIEKDPSAN